MLLALGFWSTRDPYGRSSPDMASPKKIVLAYAGGLETSVTSVIRLSGRQLRIRALVGEATGSTR